MSAVITPRPISVFPEPGELEPLYEVVNGQRIEEPRMGAFECFLASTLIRILGNFAEDRTCGRVVGETLFLLDATRDLQRRPDLAFVSFERWPRSRIIPSDWPWHVVPELAVEVVSKSNTAFEIMEKMADYFRSGVRLVWVVYPKQELIQAYTSLTSVRICDRLSVLDGDPVLPDFQLPLSKLFTHEDETATQTNGPAPVQP